MYISLRVHPKDSCFTVTECIYHCVFIPRKGVLQLRSAYITACSSQEKLFCSYIVYISLRVHPKKSCFTVTECIHHWVFIPRTVVLQLHSVYITACSSKEKLFYSYGVYISLRVHPKKSCFTRVREYIYYCVFIPRKVVLQLRSVYISLRVHPKKSCFTVTEYIYHCVFIPRKVVLQLRNVYITAC